jgi:predicted Rossmann fold nucleotide-binding protein DprA/Smf involved in DNA uptake
MTTQQITENAKAILLLCGRFGLSDDAGVKPLNIREYDEVATWLIRKNWWPVDLLNEANQAALSEAFAPVEPERMKALLGRGASMAISIEKWINKGLWVLCRSDEDYPQRLKQHLKRVAPPILYGSGDRALLSKGGLAVVGSRHVNGEAESFARAVGRSAAQSGMQLVSGAARGVDETAMHGAFEEGGSVVGVMADSLLRAAVSGKFREGIRSGQLVLVSPYNPETGFNVGNAMGRNKYIYALADFAVVVSSDYQEGGTWAGAEEELKRDVARPVFIRVGQNVPKGNTELLKLGGRPLADDALRLNLREFMEKSIAGEALPTPKDQESVLELDPDAVGGERKLTTYGRQKPEPISGKISVRETSYSAPVTIMEAVKPLILKALDKPKKVDELAMALNVRKSQIQDWIKSLIKDGILEERVIRKSKKISIHKPDEELKFS